MKPVWLALVALALAGRAQAAEPDRPVAIIVDGRLPVATEAGQGELPVSISADWTRTLPDVTRALVVVHDDARDADATLRMARAARYAAGDTERGTLLVAPQFLAEPDLVAHHMPAAVLHWRDGGWIDGDIALGPAPISSFAALDAIFARLQDTRIFPALRRVVIAGHAAGGQFVQRYAVVGRAADELSRRGVSVRYVVANPASYLWFGEDRPMAKACGGSSRWRYGLGGAPSYVEHSDDLEERYIRRDVVYLLGEADTDEDQGLLDRSCAAEAQGPNRYARGMHYLFALELRHPNLVRHRILNVWGVGHDAASVFISPCGVAALFDRPGCAAF